MTLGLEKRSGRRIPINCSLQIFLDGRELLGFALNLSVAGIRFDCPVALKPAQSLEIKLLPPNDSGTPPLQAIIEVIRCDATDTPFRFMVAAVLHSIQ